MAVLQLRNTTCVLPGRIAPSIRKEQVAKQSQPIGDLPDFIPGPSLPLYHCSNVNFDNQHILLPHHLTRLSAMLFHSLHVGPVEKLRHHPFHSQYFTKKETGANNLLDRSQNQFLETWRHMIRTQSHLSPVQHFFQAPTISEMKLKVTFGTEPP